VDVEALLTKTIQSFGRLDCAFNNAGTVNPIRISTVDRSEEEWDRTMAGGLPNDQSTQVHQSAETDRQYFFSSQTSPRQHGLLLVNQPV